MSERFGWGDAEFLGEWTIAEVVAFVQRVEEIRVEEAMRAAATAEREGKS